ncbi:two-component regulator propeller domain-containing protein [Candidatus Latescibacterota bacterium]
MRKIQFWYLVPLFVLLVLVSCSQKKPPVTVIQYTDPSYITGIVKWDDSLYCATRGGLVWWDIDSRHYTVITTAEGLISNVLTDIVVDGRNILWVSSHEGMASFDGVTWRYYGEAQGLPSSYVTDLTVDLDGNVWAATRDGVVWWDGRRFNVFTEEGGPGQKPITAIFFDKGGNIWITAEDDGIYYKIEGEWQYLSGKTGHVAQSWDMNIWVYDGMEISYWTGLTFVGYPMYNYIPAVNARYIDATDTRIWYFTDGGVHSTIGNRDWLNFDESNGLVSNDVTSGLVVSNDEIYVGTSSGLSVIRNGEIENYVIPNTPIGYNFISINFDSQDRLWLGTWENGVNIWEDGIWSAMSGNGFITDGLQTVRSFVFGSSGEVVFNTITGILFSSDDGWRLETRADGVSGDDVRCGVFDREGRYWVGTSGGICYREGQRWTRFREIHGLPSEDVWACALDGEGTVWFGTTGGIVSFTNRELRDRSADTGLDSLDVRAVYADGNTVYFGTTDGSLIVYNGESWNVFDGSTLRTTGAIYAITGEPSGAVWLGTDGNGVIRFEHGEVEQYTIDDGIPYDVVRSLAYHDGILWMACYGGIASLERGEASQ